MARSPFQGTYQPNVRPTVVTSPDAIVFINGEQEVIGCPNCTRSFNFNKYITSIQTDLSVDSVPGSASVTMAIPRHTIDDFYFDGNPVISPMMEIEIYAKGYYLVEGLPQYYPIFWGIVTEVTDNYSSGEHTVNINCADILKWWELCKMNITPAFTVPAGQEGRNLMGNVFSGTNPYDIIFSLALQSFGDVIIGTGSLNSAIQESGQSSTFNAALADLMFYWEKRFSRMRSNLLLYGTRGVAVRGDTLYQTYSRNNPPGTAPKKAVASIAIQAANGGSDGGQMVFDPASANVAAFRTVYANAGQIDLWQSEYQTKLELANAAKEAIGFEFYMDVTGDIVFKPPFYNLDILSNKPLSWIQDIDIIDWDFSESESEVVTQIIMQGSWAGTSDFGTPSDIAPFTSVTDYHLLRKYGWRTQNYNSEFLSDPQLMYYHGLDMLDRINSRRFRGSVSIPMRPELRLGFPIYIAPKDQVWYVTGISHSIQFGGRATTNLTLTGKRSKFIAPKGIGTLKLKSFNGTPDVAKDGGRRTFRYSSRQLSKGGVFELRVGSAASIPPSADAFVSQAGADNPYEPLTLRHPKTGRIVGYPNVVMAYTRPFAPADLSAQAGQKSSSQVNPNTSQQRQLVREKSLAESTSVAQDRFKADAEQTIIDKYLNNRYHYGLNSSGVYIYAHDASSNGGVIGEMLTLPSRNVQIVPEDSALDSLRSKTAMIRPVSDERGFEVIGHFQYGRRVSLRDGRLVINDGSDVKADVRLQLALGGGLNETLTAQSQGLTTVSTGFVDPASVLTTMTPEDRQTAAIINPDTKQPEFVDLGDNFMDTATLGSPEQEGSPEVEASQLSRALTLVEMSALDSDAQRDENCVCLTGRQDLAFINSGYQVQTLAPAAADVSGLFTQTLDATLDEALGEDGGPIQAGRTEQLEANVSVIQAQINQAREKYTQLSQQIEETGQRAEDKQLLNEQNDVISNLEARLQEAESALVESRMDRNHNGTVFSSKPGQALSKVDQFLVNLYRQLDLPHQQFESALRGDLLPMTPRSTDLNADATDPPSRFAPPFSAPNRFQLGDRDAAVAAVETNVEGLEETLSNFSNDLKTNADKTSLSRQISQDNADIVRLTNRKNQLKSQQNSSAVVIGVDLQQEIESIERQIATLEQNITNNRTKLDSL